jgi:hypothetical protein
MEPLSGHRVTEACLTLRPFGTSDGIASTSACAAGPHADFPTPGLE